MVLKSIIGAIYTCLAVFSFSADAALSSRLGGLAVYDSDADLTWLSDSNAAGTTGHSSDGFMTWADANIWAAGLVVDGNDNWRLPTTYPTVYGQDQAGSEMGNLFYNVLGGAAYSDIGTSHNSNYDMFSNVLPHIYWSATEYTPFPLLVWNFNMNYGDQGYYYKTDSYYAWAVQSGDVNAVPAPPALLLFLTGILGIGFARRRQA
jgi:hypothetical protein